MQIGNGPNIQQKAATQANGDLLKILGDATVVQGEANGQEQAVDGAFSELLQQQMSGEQQSEVAATVQNVTIDSNGQIAEKATQAGPGEVKANFESKFLNDQHRLLSGQTSKHPSEQPQAQEVSRKSIFDIPGRVNGQVNAGSNINQEVQALPKMATTPAGIAAIAAPQFNAKGETKAKVDLADNENLVDLKQFMEKQSPTVHKRFGEQAYKSQVERSIFADKFEKTQLPNVTANIGKSDALSSSLNNEMAQVERNLEIGAKFFPQQSSSDAGSQLASTNKPVIDLNQLNLNTDSEQVIEQIKNYIVQSKVAHNSNVEVSFKHDQLGVVDLHLRKTEGDHISITIATNSAEAAKFFTKNQGDLLASLSQSGVKVADFKLDNQNSFDSSSKQFANQGQGGHSDGFTNEQRRQHSEKRQELWNMMQEREAA